MLPIVFVSLKKLDRVSEPRSPSAYSVGGSRNDLDILVVASMAWLYLKSLYSGVSDPKSEIRRTSGKITRDLM
jgi:hypothetical protein